MTKRATVRFGEQLTPRQERSRALWTAGPGVAWLSVFLLLPLIGILAMSFLSRGTYGQVQLPLTWHNYERLIGFGTFGFDAVYAQILFRSLLMAGATVLLCLVGALPLAFALAGLPPRAKQLGLMLVVIPFWTNLLIRTYAWQILLAQTGWLARAMAYLGLVPPGTALFPGTFAVFVGLTCDYLPFLVLPLYASVEKIDWSIAEAASDLGANPLRRFQHALLPQIRPGLVAGSILVFVPATGQFVIPDLLGGAKTVLLGNAIQQQFGASRDWPFGSAIACTAMLVVLIGLWLYARIAGKPGEENFL